MQEKINLNRSLSGKSLIRPRAYSSLFTKKHTKGRKKGVALAFYNLHKSAHFVG